MDRITAQKFADVYGIDKIKQIIANCPQNCDVYRECVGDTIIRQIPIGVFQTVLVTLGHEPNPTNLNAWLNVKEQQPKIHEEVIINLNGKPQIAVYGGKARDTDEYMFYTTFKMTSGHSYVYSSSWTCNVDMWHPLSALPNNWVELEQKQPSENEEVIIRFCGEPRIAVSAGEVVGGDELFFDFGFEYDPDFCSSHDKFMSSYSHEITQWQPLPELPQNKTKRTLVLALLTNNYPFLLVHKKTYTLRLCDETIIDELNLDDYFIDCKMTGQTIVDYVDGKVIFETTKEQK